MWTRNLKENLKERERKGLTFWQTDMYCYLFPIPRRNSKFLSYLFIMLQVCLDCDNNIRIADYIQYIYMIKKGSS